MHADPISRLILYHKQSTSARTRFMKFSGGAVCGFEPLPRLSQLVDAPHVVDQPAYHPGQLLHEAQRMLGLESGGLMVESGFRAWVELPAGQVPVFLARFTAIDPPFDKVAALNGTFIDITQARDRPQVELELLRRAYEMILGG